MSKLKLFSKDQDDEWQKPNYNKKMSQIESIIKKDHFLKMYDRIIYLFTLYIHVVCMYTCTTLVHVCTSTTVLYTLVYMS